nr:hypothetical protein CFP56_52033 [Quercus suber]
MHSEGIESSGEAGHPENMNIMATIEDLQRSQAVIPPYPKEVAGKPYPVNYTPPIFPKYDGMTMNVREHIRQYVDALIAQPHDLELRLREFSKSLEGRAFTWYTSLTPGSVLSWNDFATQFMKKFFTLKEKLTLSDLQHEKQTMSEWLLEYIRRFKDLSLLCYDHVEEEKLVDVCIAGMLHEYRHYLENLQISSFTRLVKASRRTSMSIRKPSKGSTSQVVSTPKQPWRREGKKVEVAVAEEPKKVVKNKKRERGGIPPPFTISIKKVAKRDLVIKAGKRANLRMHRLEVAMTFFIGREDPMEEKAKNMASNSLAPPPLLDEEMHLKSKGPLVDPGRSTNILPLPTFDALGILRERIILDPLQVVGIGSLQQCTLGHVSLDLRVWPIPAPTLMHVMEGNTSYHIFLGRPRLKAYKAVASTYHQYVKAVWRNRQVIIEDTRMPFDRAELYFVEAILYQEYEPEGEKKFFLLTLLLCKGRMKMMAKLYSQKGPPR